MQSEPHEKARFFVDRSTVETIAADEQRKRSVPEHIQHGRDRSFGFIEKAEAGLTARQQKCDISSARCVGRSLLKEFERFCKPTGVDVHLRQIPVLLESRRGRRPVFIFVRPFDVTQSNELLEESC